MRILNLFSLMIIPVVSILAQNTYSTHNTGEVSDNLVEDMTLIVRVATQSKKIAFYQELYNSGDYTKQDAYKAKIATYQKEDDDYISSLKEIFQQEYSATPVLFVKDSAFKDLLSDKEITAYTHKDSTTLRRTDQQFLFFVNQDDKYEFILVDAYLNRLPQPWPYKKRIWLPSFKKLFSSHGVIRSQVKWLQKKMEEFKIKPLK